jgi:hypothetical protein
LLTLRRDSARFTAVVDFPTPPLADETTITSFTPERDKSGREKEERAGEGENEKRRGGKEERVGGKEERVGGKEERWVRTQRERERERWRTKRDRGRRERQRTKRETETEERERDRRERERRKRDTENEGNLQRECVYVCVWVRPKRGEEREGKRERLCVGSPTVSLFFSRSQERERELHTYLRWVFSVAVRAASLLPSLPSAPPVPLDLTSARRQRPW